MIEAFSWATALGLLWQVLAAALILVLGWFATKFVTRLARRYLIRAKVDELLVNFGVNILYWTLILVTLIAAIGTLGIDTTALIALLGAAGLAVGLALQDSMKNFASGVLLIIFRPFNLGHYVEAGGTSGIVEEITLFTTTMRTPDNRSVIVPNGAIYADVITNYSARDTRRIDMVFGIGYDDDINEARTLMMDILQADERVLETPEPVVQVSELADSSVNFWVRPWCANEDYWDLRSDITKRIKIAFDENGISIPFPQMDIHLEEETDASESERIDQTEAADEAS